jgi:hypothetical protein
MPAMSLLQDAGASRRTGNRERHPVPASSPSVMGVNMRLADESDLAGIELRYPDGQAWSGEGAFGYFSRARIIGPGATSD